jgi:hypothetical protein
MTKVSVNAPRTPVTEGSNGIAAATLPNVCKMPGPPAPFVPTPLPNIGKSGTDPKGYSKTVTIEGKKVGIRGATFGSMGDVASKGTGGGIVSSNVEGPTSFVGPGSMNVKFEGKNVQLLGDPMLNNCGPGGSPANAATMMGVFQENGALTAVTGDDQCPLCRKVHGSEGALKETPPTQANAAQLAKTFARRLLANNISDATMLGVIRCKCSKKKIYADRSGVSSQEFYDSVVVDLEWHTLEMGDKKEKVKQFILERFPNRRKRVLSVWRQADFLSKESETRRKASQESDPRIKAREQGPSAYPPGACAGPKVLMLALSNEAYPAGLTERWFHSKGEPTGGVIQFRDRERATTVERQFDHGKAVPPCKTCNLILPSMLCPEDKELKCHH